VGDGGFCHYCSRANCVCVSKPMPRLKTDAPKKPKRRGPSAGPEGRGQIQRRWIEDRVNKLMDELPQSHDSELSVQNALEDAYEEGYSLGQTFCTAHTQVYKRVQVLEERLVLAAEREQMVRQALRIMLDSATPNAKEHPTMNAAWRTARAALTEDSNGR
jgi:hypothetical protein